MEILISISLIEWKKAVFEKIAGTASLNDIVTSLEDNSININ